MLLLLLLLLVGEFRNIDNNNNNISKCRSRNGNDSPATSEQNSSRNVTHNFANKINGLNGIRPFEL